MSRRSFSWDSIPAKTAISADPAAGTLSVDVKTFTGTRGILLMMECNCLADGNAANRTFQIQKVSALGSFTIHVGLVFVAGATGIIRAYLGHPTTTNQLPFVEFEPGDILRVVVSSGQVGDNIGTILYQCKEAP